MQGVGAIRVRTRAVALTGVLVMLAGCSHGPAQTRIRHAIRHAAAAARQLDVAAIRGVLSPSFDGNGGELDRRRLLGLMRLEQVRGEHVSVIVGPIDVEPRGDRYVANFDITLGGGSGLIPRHLGVYRVHSAWRLEHGRWRCYAATWQRPV